MTREFVTRTAGEFGDAVTQATFQATSLRNILRDTRRELIGYREQLHATVEGARRKDIGVIGQPGGILVTPLCKADAPEPPTEGEMNAVQDKVESILRKATDSDESAAKTSRGLANLSKHGFTDLAVTKDRDTAVKSVHDATIRKRASPSQRSTGKRPAGRTSGARTEPIRAAATPIIWEKWAGSK